MNKLGRFVAACAAVVCALDALGAQTEKPAFRAKLTVGGYAGAATLTNFPVLVRLSSERIAGFDYARVKSTADLSFGDADGSLYPYEVDTWNPNGESLVWVKVPELAGSETGFYVRWAHVTEPANDPKAVWSDYTGVWHLNGYDATAGAADATGNGLAAVASGAAPQTADSAAVGGALKTMSSLNAPDYDATSAAAGGTLTLSGWVHAPTYDGSDCPVFLAKPDAYQFEYERGVKSAAWIVWDPKSGRIYQIKDAANVKSGWVHFAVSIDTLARKTSAYTDGVASFSNWGVGIVTNAQPLKIGSSVFQMDEVRVARIAHGAEWVKAERDTVAVDGFVTAGAAESLIGADTLNVTALPHEVGVPTPAYGQKGGLADGEPVDCTMAVTDVAVSEGMRCHLTGWDLYAIDGAARTCVRSSACPQSGEDVKTVKYVHDGAAELVWRWVTEYKVTGLCSEDEGEVTAESEWAAEGGTFTLTATPRTGFAFWRWEGDLAQGVGELETTISLPADGPRTVMAVFKPTTDITATGAEGGAALLAALATATDGTVITLAEGTYEIDAELNLTAAVMILGAGMDKTIIRQTAANQHVAVLDDARARIEGCTLTGGHFTEELKSGVGVYIKANGGILRDCRITGNDSTRNHNRGVGIFCVSANARVERCVIDGNKITGGTNACYAGGVQTSGGVFSHCLIVNNEGHNAGGVYVDGPATFEWCTIADNTVKNDTAGGYGGVRIAAAGATFANCIIAGNHSGSTDVSVGAPDWGGTLSVTFDHTALALGVGVNSCILGTPLVCDVLFEDLAVGDYRQRLASDAKDLGYYAPFDTGVFACDLKVSTASLFAGETVSLISFVAGCDAAEATYAWTVTKPDGTTDRLDGANPPYVPQQIGSYSVRLEVSADDETTDYALSDCFFAALASATVTTGPELEQAVAVSMHGSVITCAPGDYALDGTLKLGKGIRLIGSGWDGCTLRQTKKGVRTLFLDDADDFVEGFTVTGGQNTNEGEHGRGVYIGAHGGTLSKCRVIGNVGTRNWTHGMGVAMIGDGLVTHCVISNNTLASGYYNTYGGGIYASMGAIDNCLVADNANVSSSESKGGGIYAVGSVKVCNCTVVRNESRETGGGVYAKNGTEKFVNCIIAGNKTSSGDTTAGRPEWGAATGKGLFDHCLLPAGVTTNATTGGTCVVADPVFVNAAAGDFREQTSSPSKDAGVAYEGLADVDLDGADRVSGKGVDIGCYEFDSSAFTVAFTGPAGMNGFTGVQATFAASVSGLDDGDVPDYAWTVVTPTGREFYGTGATLTVDADEPGNWQVSVTASFGGRTSPAYGETYYAVPRELYVKVATAEAAAASRFPYGTWATAATNVLDAIAASIPGCTIFLDEGEHRVVKTVSLEKCITMVGAGREKTTLRQSATDKQVLYLNHAEATVRGVTLTGFRATKEAYRFGAVVVDAQGGAVEDCRITGSTYVSGLNQSSGCGIKLVGSRSVCRRTVIDRNCGSLRSSFDNNWDRGGAVFMQNGLLENCLICFNTNRFAGGIYVESGAATIRNCTVYGNVGIDHDDGYGANGAGGFGQVGGTANVENTIFAANESPNQSWTTGGYPEWRVVGGTAKFTNCMLPAGVTWPTSAADCLNGSPIFRNLTAEDFRLKRSSPGVDAGKNGRVEEATDLLGQPRIVRRVVDMGCYENQSDAFTLIVR